MPLQRIRSTWPIAKVWRIRSMRGQFTTFWQIPEKTFTVMRWGKLLPNDNFEKKKLQLCERENYYLLTDSRKKLYNYAMGQITSKWQFREKKITIMRKGKLLPNDRFKTKKIITIMWKDNLLPIDRFQPKKIITIMWEANLLSIDRFQPKKIITIMWEANLLSIDRFQTKTINTIMWVGNFTIFWQIPAKKNNYNYERAIYYLLTDSRKKKLQSCGRTIYYLLTDSKLKRELQLCERAIYYLLADSRRKKIITIMWKDNLLPIDRFPAK